MVIPIYTRCSLLTLRTDSTPTDVGSETIHVRFQSNSLGEETWQDSYNITFSFTFASHPYYRTSCGADQNFVGNFVGNLPSEGEQIWTIRKTTTFFEVKCNGIVLVSFYYSTIGCGDELSFDSKSFLFNLKDGATDAYRITIEGNINSR